MIQPVLKVVCKYGDIVLDGFPRTIPQANWLIEYAAKIKRPIKCIIHLEASEQVVKERLLSRGRPDDTEEGISARFREYEKNTLPIIRHYEEIGVPVVHVSGVGEEKDISTEIIEKLKKFVS